MELRSVTRKAEMLSIALALYGLACSSPVEPEGLAAVRPELWFFELQRGRMRDGGILFVEMAPIDTSFRLATNEYLAVSVTSPAGESETLRLRRAICGLEEGQAYACRFLSISVKSGYDVRGIEPDLNRMNARLTLVAATPTFGSAYAFGDWSRTMESVRRLPNVMRVDFVRILRVAHPDLPPFAAWLAGALPFSRGTPTSNDGRLTAVSSDTLTITYFQPDGSSLTYRVSPPPE
jgi:hypothetical protein